MDKSAYEQPSRVIGAAYDFTEAPCGVAAVPVGLDAVPRSHRQGSERVYVDDLSYEPMTFIDTLLVTFCDN